jgi:hypothetical protein
MVSTCNVFRLCLRHVGLHGGFSPQDYIQLPVTRFLLNPNIPLWVSLTVNSFEFMPCDSTPQVECLCILLIGTALVQKHSTLTVWATEVSNLICSPHFRSSVYRNYKSTSFVIGVPTCMLLFYQYSGHSVHSIILLEIIFLFLCLTNHTI